VGFVIAHARECLFDRSVFREGKREEGERKREGTQFIHCFMIVSGCCDHHTKIARRTPVRVGLGGVRVV
jgi:hypothetical protein